jgi:ribosome assembly protein RRB1
MRYEDTSSEGEMDEQGQEEEAELEEQMENLKVYLPGEQMGEGEELVVDQSTYDMLHSMGVEWPCLSFDFVAKQTTTTYPHSCLVVMGSQAEKQSENKLYVMKISKLSKTIEPESDEESDEEDDYEDPVIEYKTIPQFGSTNRIRTSNVGGKQLMVSMAETGKVHIHDISAHIASFDTPGIYLLIIRHGCP